MTYRITYYGEHGTVYSELDDTYEDGDLTEGEWDDPFPNKNGESSAFGCVESLIQSDRCPYAFMAEENIVKVKIEKVEDNP